jgi:thiamine kinase-like enzyme
VLCHNDVQLANLNRGRDGRLWLIDWEYAGRGNPYFDLAMIVNNAGLGDADAARVRVAYFGADRDADFARIELERFDSAMREGLWSVVAEPVLTTDWDFRAWADRFLDIARRMAERIRRDELIARAGPASDDRAVFERTFAS